MKSLFQRKNKFVSYNAAAGATLENIKLEDVNITGVDRVGGLVGHSDGSVTNASVSGAVAGRGSVGGLIGTSSYSSTVNNSHATGNVSGSSRSVGGLIGMCGGTVSSCYATSDVTSNLYVGGLIGNLEGQNPSNRANLTDSFAQGSVNGFNYVGVLIGNISYGNVGGCYSTGVATGSTESMTGGLVGAAGSADVSNSYSTASATGKYVGGLIGYTDSAAVSNCYATGSVSGLTGAVNKGRLIGYKSLSTSIADSFYNSGSALAGDGTDLDQGTAQTPAQLRTQDVFTGWDFGTVWNIVNTKTHLSFPYLRNNPQDPPPGYTDVPLISDAIRTDDTHITVTLNKDCQNLDKSSDGGFTVTQTGMATTYAVSTTAQGGNSSQVVLTVADISSAGTSGVTVTYTAGVNGTIADTEGTALATDSTGKDIAAWISSGGHRGSDSSGNNGAAVIVNGETKIAGAIQTTTNLNGQSVTTVTVDSNKLANILASESNGATVIIPVTGDSDIAAGTLTGAMVKCMENKDATLVVQTDSGTYILPASEINIDAVSQQLATDVALSDIKVTISVAEPSAAMTQVVEKAAQDGGYTILVPAVEYSITCTYGDQTVNFSSFNAYVERTIAIPDGVDPTKITTGVVVDADGTTRHVPTRVTVIDGKYYAVINSLTNSTYSVIWNPVEFSDVTNHWAKDAINDMGSRIVVNGVGNNHYTPDRNMTRAEFASIIVRALGLEPGTGASGFGDVNTADWYCGYVETATAYGIINGYGNGNFGPDDTITREQAMAMIARAMEITGLKVSLSDSEISGLLGAYSDGTLVADYAVVSIAACLRADIVSGAGNATIAPKDYVTRAEVATMVQRLLEKSELI